MVVDKLSKQYVLGRHPVFGRTFREMLIDAAKAPWRALFGRDHEPETRDFWALRDVSFEVQPGEIVGVIGRNGAGKSTLLKILGRITEPTRGRAKLCGRVASLLEIGTGFHPELTGRENIFLNGALLGMTRAEIRSKFDAIVSFAEIEEFLDTAVKHYSSGMYLRLAFAVAAHLEAEILLVDEVLAVGDVAFQRKCLGKMRELTGSTGRTVIFVSHNMAAVESLCERALYFERGMLKASGPPRQIIVRYFSSIAADRNERDLDSLPRPHDLGNEFRLTSVRICDEAGATLCSIPLGRRFDVRFTYRVTQGIPDVLVYIRFETLWGEIIIDSWDRDTLPRESVEPGEYTVSVCVDPQDFHPGQYQISLGAGVLMHRWMDRVDGALVFTIEPFSEHEIAAPERTAVLYRKLTWQRTQSASHAAARETASAGISEVGNTRTG